MKLSDTQLVLLSAAAQREDRVLELQSDIDAAAAEKLATKLAGAGLIEEIAAGGSMPVWRRLDDAGFALRITDAGLAAIGVVEAGSMEAGGGVDPKPDDFQVNPSGEKKASGKRKSKKAKPETEYPHTPSGHPGKGGRKRPPTSGGTTKLDQVQSLLERKRGATIREMIEATGWQPHTTRAVLTGFRKRGLGLERENLKDKPSVYRITGAAPARTARRARRSA